MSWRDGGALVRGLVMPAELEAEIRKELLRIDKAETAVNCLILQAGTEGLVKGLELLKAAPAANVEKLYVLIDSVASARLLELELVQ